MKIQKSQVIQIIKEEAQKIKQEMLLKKMLNEINKELNELNEVHAGGEMAPGADGVHAGQKKAVFTKKGSHLVEDQEDEMTGGDEESFEEVPSDEMGGEDEMGPEIGGEEIEMDIDGEEMGPEIGGDEMGTGESLSMDSIKAALEKLGAELGLSGQIDFDAAMGEEGIEGMGDEEMEVDIETGAEDAVGGEESGLEISSDEISDEEETSGEMGDEAPAEEPSAEEAPADEEQIDECGDEETMMAEKAHKLNEEQIRWKKLAGIIKS